MEETIWRTTPLYVYAGKNHKNCDNKNLIKKNCVFFQGKEKFYQEVGFCPKCGKCFIMQNDMKNLSNFCDYKLFHSLTLERVRVDVSTNWQQSSEPKTPNKNKKYVDNGWYINHPLQGGGCSGK